MIIIITYALSIIFEFNLVGRLLGADLFALVLLPFTIKTLRRHPLSTVEMKIAFLLLLWFSSAFITDVVRGTPFEDIARGWSKILLFGLHLVTIRSIVNCNERKAIRLVLVLALAIAIKMRLDIGGQGFGANIFGDGWKFGYGFALAAVVFFIAGRWRGSYLFPAALLVLPFADSILNLALNARNLFGLTAISALLSLITFRTTQMSGQKIAGLIMVGTMFSWILIGAYSFAAGNGYLGKDAQAKYVTQTEGSLGLLLGGRSESLASTAAIADSPFIGHGSWARDIKYVEIRILALQNAGYEINGDPFKDDLIPSHSHLLGAWVESGIMGAIFWFWILIGAAKRLYSELRRPSAYVGFLFFIGTSLAWDVLFSPFGLDRRVITAAWIVLLLSTRASITLPQNKVRL